MSVKITIDTNSHKRTKALEESEAIYNKTLQELNKAREERLRLDAELLVQNQQIAEQKRIEYFMEVAKSQSAATQKTIQRIEKEKNKNNIWQYEIEKDVNELKLRLNKVPQAQYNNGRLVLYYNVENKIFNSGNLCLSLKRCQCLYTIMFGLKQKTIAYNANNKNISTLNKKIKDCFGVETNLIKNKKIDYDSFDFDWIEN